MLKLTKIIENNLTKKDADRLSGELGFTLIADNSKETVEWLNRTRTRVDVLIKGNREGSVAIIEEPDNQGRYSLYEYQVEN